MNLGINFTKVNNKVIELAPGVESIMLGGFVEPQIRAQAGCTYPNIYGLGFKRDEAGNLLLLNGLPGPHISVPEPEHLTHHEMACLCICDTAESIIIIPCQAYRLFAEYIVT